MDLKRGKKDARDNALVVRTAKRKVVPRGISKSARDVMVKADLMAVRAIRTFNVPAGLIFWMAKDSIDEIIACTSCEYQRVRYTARNDETTHYLLINIEPSPSDEQERICHATWYKDENGEYAIYDPVRGIWNSSEGFATLCKMIRASDGALELLDDVAMPFGFPEQLRADQAKTLLLNNEAIIALNDSMDGMSQVIVKERDEDFDDISGLSAMLVPTDDAPRGFAICVVNGGFSLCQYLAREDVDMYIHNVTGRPIRECAKHDGEDFINPVFTTNDAGRIKRAVSRLIGEKVAPFSFPISENARGVAMFLGGPCIIKGNKGSLTEEENARLKDIENEMDLVLNGI